MRCFSAHAQKGTKTNAKYTWRSLVWIVLNANIVLATSYIIVWVLAKILDIQDNRGTITIDNTVSNELCDKPVLGQESDFLKMNKSFQWKIHVFYFCEGFLLAHKWFNKIHPRWSLIKSIETVKLPHLLNLTPY